MVYYRDSKLIKSARDKISNKNFNLSNEETNEIKQCLNNSFYIFHDFIYDNLSLRNDRALEVNKKYDQAYWSNFIDWMNSLKDVRLKGWFTRTVLSNLEIGIWNCKSKNVIGYLPVVSATKALMTRIDKKDKNNFKDCVVSLYGRRSIDPVIIDELISQLTPDLFKNDKEYLFKLSEVAHKSIILLSAYERLHNNFSEEEHNRVYKNIEKIILYRVANVANKRLIFAGVRNKNIFNYIKNNYSDKHKEKIIKFINLAEHRDIEMHDFKLAKDLINLDVDLTISLQERYFKSLSYKRHGQLKSNKDRMVKFLKTVPGASPRKALLQLSQYKKNREIEYIASKFPELKKLISLT